MLGFNSYVGKNVKLGKGVKIWNLTYIGDDASIGDETSIGSLAHIDYNVKIGRKVKIEGMVYIPPLTEIGDDVFIGPGVVFTNDPYPPSSKWKGIKVEDGAVIGAGAVIKAGVRIGRRSVVAMGALVTKDVPDEAVVMGFPARVVYTRDEYEAKKGEWEAIGDEGDPRTRHS